MSPCKGEKEKKKNYPETRHQTTLKTYVKKNTACKMTGPQKPVIPQKKSPSAEKTEAVDHIISPPQEYFR